MTAPAALVRTATVLRELLPTPAAQGVLLRLDPPGIVPGDDRSFAHAVAVGTDITATPELLVGEDRLAAFLWPAGDVAAAAGCAHIDELLASYREVAGSRVNGSADWRDAVRAAGYRLCVEVSL